VYFELAAVGGLQAQLPLGVELALVALLIPREYEPVASFQLRLQSKTSGQPFQQFAIQEAQLEGAHALALQSHG
jgi:hypothetical protein